MVMICDGIRPVVTVAAAPIITSQSGNPIGVVLSPTIMTAESFASPAVDVQVQVRRTSDGVVIGDSGPVVGLSAIVSLPTAATVETRARQLKRLGKRYSFACPTLVFTRRGS